MIRPIVAHLCEELKRAHPASAAALVLLAGLIFEQSNKLETLEELSRTNELDSGSVHAASRATEIRDEYIRYAEQGIFDWKYLGLRLTNDERDSMTRTLLELIDRDSPLASDAASALSLSGRPFVVPHLARTVYSKARDDEPTAATCIRAIAELLNSSSIRSTPDLPMMKPLISAGIQALEFASREGMDGPLGANDEGARQLTRLRKIYPGLL